jgi:hypothetical protein
MWTNFCTASTAIQYCCETTRAAPRPLSRGGKTGRDVNSLTDVERTSGLHFSTVEERRALVERDNPALYALGAHPLLLLTITIPVYEHQFPDFITLAHDFQNKIDDLGHPDFGTWPGGMPWLRTCRSRGPWRNC